MPPPEVAAPPTFKCVPPGFSGMDVTMLSQPSAIANGKAGGVVTMPRVGVPTGTGVLLPGAAVAAGPPARGGVAGWAAGMVLLVVLLPPLPSPAGVLLQPAAGAGTDERLGSALGARRRV